MKLRLPPGASHEDLDPRGTGGQFLVVIAGSIAYRGGALAPLDVIFVSAEEPAFRLDAQDHGAEVVLMQLPVKAAAYDGHGWTHVAQSSRMDL